MENKVNNEFIAQDRVNKINKLERYIFKNVDCIFCVSKKFMNYMKSAEPEFKDKFSYNYNGLDLNKIKNNAKNYNTGKKKRQIVSIGGGMKQKNNLAVCEAIDKLNRDKNMNLEYIVIGLPYTDKEKICKYDFVTYYDKLPHESVIEILTESYLYIQNSTFETFGLAIIEALYSKCNLLISNNVGAIEVIKTIKDQDIIFEQNNIEEISGKIEKIINSENNKRLYNGILEDEIRLEKAAKSLLNKIITESI